VLLRVHDACFTSEVLGSLKCDCREQLQLAMDFIQDSPPGLVIYLQQEGRGIGLANKIAAYALQEKGLDTVDANRALGLPDDCREYSAVKHILDDLGVQSVRLMTNNPRKISEVAALGVSVVERVPCLVKSHKYNRGYLDAKQRRMEHMLSSDDEAEGLQGQFCFFDHEGEPGPAGIPLEPVLLPNPTILSSDEKVAVGATDRTDNGNSIRSSAQSSSAGIDSGKKKDLERKFECGTKSTMRSRSRDGS
jgi:GTP cyclohydrolase II